MDDEMRMAQYHAGQCIDAWKLFGAHRCRMNNCEGVGFAVYAPHARNVFVIGSFTNWEDHPIRMIRTGFTGVWQVFVPNVYEWDSYKYRIETNRGDWIDKADPFAFYAETRPETASKVVDLRRLTWSDEIWQSRPSSFDNRPVSIYEVYAGGWKKNGNNPYTYAMLEKNLIPYVRKMGFTHIELMPLQEHPFDGSWGYQVSGCYALTSRYGNPYEFASFVNACHRQGIGVILDMVPVHFCADAFGLARFDGEALYEYSRPEDAWSEWGTLNFDLGREEVRSFLMSACAFWCEMYHIDGLRLDAISNIIYWGGNKDRGINQGGIDFIKRLNYYMHQYYPKVWMCAEDSTAYPGVTTSVQNGGLGFDGKWDLGWMHDTLDYFGTSPEVRITHPQSLLFSMQYFYREHFVLPLSHDENVHGKHTVMGKMYGRYEDRFAQLRALYGYMFAHPGKKLNFMGNEIAMFREFDESRALDWNLLDYPSHASFQKYFARLNELYQQESALFVHEDDPVLFYWFLKGEHGVFGFVRGNLLCLLNTSDKKQETEIPGTGAEVLLDSEAKEYGGRNNCQVYIKDKVTNIVLMPYACLWLRQK